MPRRGLLAACAAAMAVVMSAAAGAHATSAANVSYGGGPVKTVPKVYLVFWGAEWNVEGDPSGEAAYLEAFYRGLYGSGDTWTATLSQYCQGAPAGAQTCPTGAQFVGRPSGQLLGGVWYDTALPSAPEGGTTTIGQEAVAAATHFGNTSPGANVNAQYVVATPPKRWAPGTGVLYCSWHSTASASYGPVAYTYLPYLTDWAITCGGNAVNAGAAGTRDGVSLVAGQQYADVVTDPVPTGGWTDSAGQEIGQKCPWTSSPPGIPHNVTLGTGTFAVPWLWSNAANNGAGACV